MTKDVSYFSFIPAPTKLQCENCGNPHIVIFKDIQRYKCDVCGMDDYI